MAAAAETVESKQSSALIRDAINTLDRVNKYINIQFTALKSVELFWTESSPYVSSMIWIVDDSSSQHPVHTINIAPRSQELTYVSKKAEFAPHELVRIVHVEMFPLPSLPALRSLPIQLLSGLQFVTSQGRVCTLQNDHKMAVLAKQYLSKQMPLIKEDFNYTYSGAQMNGFELVQNEEMCAYQSLIPKFTARSTPASLPPAVSPSEGEALLGPEQKQERQERKQQPLSTFSSLRAQLPSFTLGFVATIAFAITALKFKKILEPCDGCAVQDGEEITMLPIQSQNYATMPLARQSIPRLSYIPSSSSSVPSQ